MELELTEGMVTEHRAFNNCGSFKIVIQNETYNVKYDNHTRQISTDAPENIKQAIEKWWFI